MSNTTSNDMMEREFKMLQAVQGLQPAASVYEKIQAQTSGLGLRVSKKWFAGAAAALALVLCLEVVLLMQSNKTNTSNEVETLVQNENYSLYE